MKAILLKDFGGAEMMVFGDVETPTPGNGQISIKVAATSVNRADVVQRQGNYAPPKGDSEILGLEVAGTVAALGARVTQWKIGDRVMALVGGGGYAEYAVVCADHAVPIPENMGFKQAACVCETYITAYLNIFMLAGLANGQSGTSSPSARFLTHPAMPRANALLCRVTKADSLDTTADDKLNGF